jgi:hypothetical protein
MLYEEKRLRSSVAHVIRAAAECDAEVLVFSDGERVRAIPADSERAKRLIEDSPERILGVFDRFADRDELAAVIAGAVRG